jgi:hypothetical protein
MLVLTADFLYARAAAAPPEAQTLGAEGGVVRLPVAGLGDGNLHFFSAEVGGSLLRFMVIRKPDGNWATALDACMICGRLGYRQDGSNVVCRNCAAAIYVPTIGQAGGCNPVGVPSHLEGGELVLQLTDKEINNTAQRSLFDSHGVDKSNYQSYLIFAIELSGKNLLSLFIPEGFAHGFLTLEENTVFLYKCSEFYHKESETTLMWNDTGLKIDWKTENPIVSAKDRIGIDFKNFNSPF